LVDQEGIRITFLDITVSGSNTNVNVSVENNTNISVIVGAGNEVINGIAIPGGGAMFQTVTAGQSVTTRVSFFTSRLAEYGITEIDEVRLSFIAWKADTMETVFSGDIVTITPSGTTTPTSAPSPSPVSSPEPSPPPTEVVVIQVLENFGTWTGSGARTARVSADSNDFQRLTLGGNVVSSNHYTVTAGSTVITLSAGYISTLADGTHNFRAEFSTGYADLALIVNRGFGPVPQTGVSSVLPITIIMLLSFVLTISSGVYLYLHIKKCHRNSLAITKQQFERSF